MKKLSSLPELQSKENASSTSSIGIEYSQISTENDYLSNAVSKLTQQSFPKLTKEEWIEMGNARKQKWWKNR